MSGREYAWGGVRWLFWHLSHALWDATRASTDAATGMGMPAKAWKLCEKVF